MPLCTRARITHTITRYEIAISDADVAIRNALESEILHRHYRVQNRSTYPTHTHTPAETTEKKYQPLVRHTRVMRLMR